MCRNKGEIGEASLNSWECMTAVDMGWPVSLDGKRLSRSVAPATFKFGQRRGQTKD